MKAHHVLLLMALAALLIPASACNSIPSPDGDDAGVVKPTVSHGARTSVIYKDTRPRPQTGYANVERPEQYKWW